MNLIDRYLEEGKELTYNTIINSQNDTGLNGELLDGFHVNDLTSGVITLGETVLSANTFIGSFDNAITTAVRSNVAVRSDLDVIESRLDTLESVSLMGMSVAPLRMMEMTPMTAVFQGSEYEIILADGSIFRTTNFQVREIRGESN